MNHHLQSLGWTLVHFCWQAAAIALGQQFLETAAEALTEIDPNIQAITGRTALHGAGGC